MTRLDQIADHLDRAGVHLNSVQLQQLSIFDGLLMAENEASNLVSRNLSFDDLVYKHYVDSFLVAQKISLPRSLLDIGTGAGFPGLLLKMIQPPLRLYLAEPRSQRLSFLKKACQALDFKDVGIFPRKINGDGFPVPLEGVISRALTSVNAFLDLAKPLLKTGGQAIIMKGPKVKGEFDELSDPQCFSGFQLDQDIQYQIPTLSHPRRLLVFKSL